MTRRRKKPVTLAGPVPYAGAEPKRQRKALAQPGFEGSREVEPINMQDPYDRFAPRVEAPFNIRCSPVEHLFARGQITIAQRDAGNHFQRVYEKAMLGQSGAVDYSRPRVDGGMIKHPERGKAIDARRELDRIRNFVGKRFFWLLEEIAGKGHRIDTVADALQGCRASNLTRERVGWAFRVALDDVLELYGIAVGLPSAVRVWKADDFPKPVKKSTNAA